MDLSDAARLIEQSPDFHLLRRVPPVAQWNIERTGSDIRRAVFVDTETTGLDHDSDEVIELALLPFEYERETGRIVRVDEAGALSALRQPSFRSRRKARAFTASPTPMSRARRLKRRPCARLLNRRN
jgi:DNA polymerase-3 subunit epsilon